MRSRRARADTSGRMRLYEIVLPLAFLAIIAIGVRFEYHQVVDKGAHGSPTLGIPVGTPISSPICGVDGSRCRINFDYYKPAVSP